MRLSQFLLIGLALLLAACSSKSGPNDQAETISYGSREDSQGSVTVKVTPLNLGIAQDTLNFEVVMDTHSVELSMDLAAIAALSNDRGDRVQAVDWPVGSGHHYEGVLSFPSSNSAGKPLLEDATRVVLVLTGLDAAERRFEWDINAG